jgi:hypothetical protein
MKYLYNSEFYEQLNDIMSRAKFNPDINIIKDIIWDHLNMEIFTEEELKDEVSEYEKEISDLEYKVSDLESKLSEYEEEE